MLHSLARAIFKAFGSLLGATNGFHALLGSTLALGRRSRLCLWRSISILLSSDLHSRSLGSLLLLLIRCQFLGLFVRGALCTMFLLAIDLLLLSVNLILNPLPVSAHVRDSLSVQVGEKSEVDL
ncbi:hypothetical protein K470DRAFT_284898 [Piedraia hortae CBS 480.64]|uniref:Uncharacterized protein n=1 Tax=Piedraia hortae CBS 480.64 TaxID=1314780 RepID=A0A6A7C3M2_9PEZI|nr:hypothetical protein K470DRAFT_284898 [Piedraia hortae CBS 480.64]